MRDVTELVDSLHEYKLFRPQFKENLMHALIERMETGTGPDLVEALDVCKHRMQENPNKYKEIADKV